MPATPSSSGPADASLAPLRRARLGAGAVAILCAVSLPFQLRAGATSPTLTSRPAVVHRPHAPTRAVHLRVPPHRVGPLLTEVQNFPRTVVIGHIERFWVRLPSLRNKNLLYVLRYPNGEMMSARVRADATGYSQHNFRLSGYHLRHFREENVMIRVETSSGVVKASLPFAVQRPSR